VTSVSTADGHGINDETDGIAAAKKNKKLLKMGKLNW
jgi:hypothetical protein